MGFMILDQINKKGYGIILFGIQIIVYGFINDFIDTNLNLYRFQKIKIKS